MVVVVMIVLVVLIFGGFFLLSRTLRRRRAQPAPAFVGAPVGFATVTALRNTHHGVNGSMYYDVTLDVQTPDGARFSAVTRELMWAGRAQSLQPGTVLPVRYRPDDPSAVALVEDQDNPATAAQVQAAWSTLQSRQAGQG